MGRFVTIGEVEQTAPPYMWRPMTTPPKFVVLAPSALASEDMPTPSVKAPPEIVDIIEEMVVEDVPTPIAEDVAEALGEAVEEALEAPEALGEALPIPTEDEATAAMEESVEAVETQEAVPSTPLSLNLLNIRRRLALTPEEFARPIIDDGEGLINRLEAGFSRASAEVARLICDAWGINQKYLFTGQGPMFLMQDPMRDYARELVTLLKQYLSVATFDRKGNQYWKGSLVNDLMRLIDVQRLTGSEAARIIRVVYDYLDAEQFEEILERMGL